MNTVRITLEGGVIQHIDVPKGIQVVVKDYNTDGVENSLLSKDSNGDSYVRSEWHHAENSPGVNTVEFIAASSLGLSGNIWELLRDTDWSWGGAAHTLIKKADFRAKLESVVQDDEVTIAPRVFEKLDSLCDEVFVDLET